MSQVRVKVEGRFAGVSSRAVGDAATAMLQALERAGAEVSILLTGDEEMRVLNRTYRRKDRPTDVLAFAQHEDGEPAGPLLGDVVVSVPTARRQAEEHGRSLAHELDALLAHGLLHLLGWDHPTDATERAMNREAERLCEAAQRVRPRRSSRRRTSSSRSRR